MYDSNSLNHWERNLIKCRGADLNRCTTKDEVLSLALFPDLATPARDNPDELP